MLIVGLTGVEKMGSTISQAPQSQNILEMKKLTDELSVAAQRPPQRSPASFRAPEATARATGG